MLAGEGIALLAGFRDQDGEHVSVVRETELSTDTGRRRVFD
jgi:hypothetical protein